MPDLSSIEQMTQPDPRGVLALRNLPPDTQRAEDATQYADRQRMAYADYLSPAMWGVSTRAEVAAALKVAADAIGKTNMPGYGGFVRPATDTERVLLEHLGYTLPTDDAGDPAPLYTVVTYPMSDLRCRRWPQLESQGGTTP
jgi:hypothetical protein